MENVNVQDMATRSLLNTITNATASLCANADYTFSDGAQVSTKECLIDPGTAGLDRSLTKLASFIDTVTDEGLRDYLMTSFSILTGEDLDRFERTDISGMPLRPVEDSNESGLSEQQIANLGPTGLPYGALVVVTKHGDPNVCGKRYLVKYSLAARPNHPAIVGLSDFASIANMDNTSNVVNKILTVEATAVRPATPRETSDYLISEAGTDENDMVDYSTIKTYYNEPNDKNLTSVLDMLNKIGEPLDPDLQRETQYNPETGFDPIAAILSKIRHGSSGL